MFSVKPVAVMSSSHEKLRPILVALSIVSHCNDSSMGKGQSLVELVDKGSTINALTPSSRACWVATLHHEVFDHPVEQSAIVVTF